MSTYNVHAGHCPTGKGAYGAVGILNESTEARKVKDLVISKLKALGHTVYDCTCEENTTQNGCLQKIVAKCNAHTVDLDISIHLNAGRNDYQGDGSTGGTEVYCYNNNTKDIATKICSNIAALGYRNRGVFINTAFYVLRNTKSPAILIECAFVDDKDDANLWNVENIASAIVKGITGKTVDTSTSNTSSVTTSYMVKITATSLNVRAGVGTSYKVNTVVHKGEVYTIVAVSNGWGKLKSGAGWVNLSYTTKI